MINRAASPPTVRGPSGPDRWRRSWSAILLLVLVVATGFLVGRRLQSPAPVAATLPPITPASVSPSPSAPVLEATGVPVSPSPSPSPSTTTLGSGVLRLPGEVPTHGSGRFTYATSRGPVLGDKGPLRRFRVGVEEGSGEDVAAFAAAVAATLGDPRGWTGGGTMRMRLVGGSDAADFTVLLATRDTAGTMCLQGGTNIRINGIPYTSCRTTGRAIINLDRWRLSAKPFRYAKVPLATYRQYVINHEVGHELGYHHQNCPKAGGPAPVMVQQTLTTRGCAPYAWPRKEGRFLTGPPR